MIQRDRIDSMELEQERKTRGRRREKSLTQCYLPAFDLSYCGETSQTKEQKPNHLPISDQHHLTLDNMFIQKELQVVRQAAIQAIIQKEEIIEELQSLISNIHSKADDKSRLNYEMNIKVDELEMERRQLVRTIQRIREDQIDELTDKDNLICQLGEELDNLRERMGELLRSDHELNQRVEGVEKQNLELQYSLIQSKLQLTRVKETLREYEQVSTEDRQEELEGYQQANHTTTEINLISQVNIAEQTLEEQRKRHQDELESIKRHYDLLLADSSIICENGTRRSSQHSDAGCLSSQILYSNVQSNPKLCDRRRSSITSRLDEVYEEGDNRVETANNFLMASLQSTSSLYKDSGFSRLHFCYEQRFLKENQIMRRTRQRLSRYQVLETVQEKSDYSAGRSSRENLYETVEFTDDTLSAETSKMKNVDSLTERSDQSLQRGNHPAYECQVASKAASYLERFVGWSALVVAGGLLLRYLVSDRQD